ncbi:MAG: PfkB family carbohydrate kinase, partial [Flavobacteriales bacterium]
FTNDLGIVSVVGDDFPKSYIDLFHSKHVNTDGLEIKKGEKSFFWAGKYHNDMNSRDTLATELNVLADFKPVVPAKYKNADIVMLGNLSPDVQLSVIEQMENRPKLVVLDTMNFWMDIALDDLNKVIAKIDVLTINDEEARQLSGEYSLVKAAKKIIGMGPKVLIIKKGE